MTVDEKLNLLLEEIVASGLYPSKAELMQCSLIRLLKDLGLIHDIIDSQKKPAESKHSIPERKDKRQKSKKEE